MTAVSIQMSRGQSGTKISDFTVGTAAPATLDLELRYQLADTNANPLTREDIILFMKAVERLLLTGGLQSPAGTFLQPGPGI
jgi:hypothetical protein